MSKKLFEIIAKMSSKYITNCTEDSLKKRLLTSRDLDKLPSYLINLNLLNLEPYYDR